MCVCAYQNTIPDSQGQVSSNKKYVYGFFCYGVVIVMNSNVCTHVRAWMCVCACACECV